MSYPTEREIETALVQQLHYAEEWRVLARQLKLPMGILDLLIMRCGGRFFVPVVIELKRGTIDEAACAQAMGYGCQIDNMVHSRIVEKYGLESRIEKTAGEKQVSVWVIGSGITKRAWRLVAGNQLAFIPYKIREHGRIEFPIDKYRLAGFQSWRDAVEDYDTPKPIEVVSGALEENAKTRIRDESRWDNDGGPFYRITQGINAECKDWLHEPRDPIEHSTRSYHGPIIKDPAK